MEKYIASNTSDNNMMGGIWFGRQESKKQGR